MTDNCKACGWLPPRTDYDRFDRQSMLTRVLLAEAEAGDGTELRWGEELWIACALVAARDIGDANGLADCLADTDV
jgi:hypothetical protein